MADKKKAAKKVKAEQIEPKGDVRIVIGAKKDVPHIDGVETWSFAGEEVTEKGDRLAVAYLTTQELYTLGWIRRKF